MSQATRVLSALVLDLALGIGLAAWNLSIADSGATLGISRGPVAETEGDALLKSWDERTA